MGGEIANRKLLVDSSGTRSKSFVCLFVFSIFIFKVRYASAMLTDAEVALTTQNKAVGLKRLSLTRCENKLLDLKEQKVSHCVEDTKKTIEPLTDHDSKH